MGKKAMGLKMVVTVAFLIVELSYLYNLISIPLLKQTSETMWILGLTTGFLITISCMAVLNYKSNKRSESKKEIVDNIENKKSKIVKIKR